MTSFGPPAQAAIALLQPKHPGLWAAIGSVPIVIFIVVLIGYTVNFGNVRSWILLAMVLAAALCLRFLRR